jgi:glycosyltransferase involved in cell wall biosynthesis
VNIVLVGVFPPYRGGIANFYHTLAEKLIANHKVTAINLTTQYPNFLFPGKSQISDTTQSKIYEAKRILSTVNPISWSKTAQKIIQLKPDLIIFKYWMPFFAPSFGYVARKVKKTIDTRVLVICDNIIPHERHLLAQTLTKSFFNFVDNFIVMSESVKLDLLKIVPEAKYKLTPHPIYDIFGVNIDKDKARKTLGIKAKNVILFFGLIREYKGLDILLKSIPKIKQELNDFIVIVAGECYEKTEKYFAIVEKLKIQDSVDFRLKFIPDNEVSEYFSATDVVALPYRTATQSGIIQIAYNFDRPIIVSDVGGLAEIVPNGKTGYVVKPDSNEFAKAIIKYFKENKFEEFSKNIKIHKQLFSWEKFIDKLMELASG